MTGILLTMADVHDTGGRPLGERRASADAKRGVPFDLQPCPYHDERHGRPMNTSALVPTMRHFVAVTSAVRSFHAEVATEAPSYFKMLCAVMDQLAGPARHLLETRSVDAPVPEGVSAGHKLAAGFFGALQAILRRDLIRGGPADATQSDFDAFVHEQRLLLGSSDVCAGAPGSIQKLSSVFLGDAGQATPSAAPSDDHRVEVARALAAQVLLGIVWQLFDESVERRLLVEPMAGGWLAPKTPYLADRIRRRIDVLSQYTTPPSSLEAHALDAVGDTPVAELLPHLLGRAATASERSVLQHLCDTRDVAVEIRGEDARTPIVEALARLLAIHRGFVDAQWRLERSIRQAVGYPTGAGMKLNALLFPTPRALEWLEIFCGHRLQCVPGSPTELVLRNHHRVVPFV